MWYAKAALSLRAANKQFGTQLPRPAKERPKFRHRQQSEGDPPIESLSD